MESIKCSRYREASWNYIAPSRTQVIQWIMEAWDGPKSKVTAAAIRKGAGLCYMETSLDEDVARWDHCKADADYDAFDWKSEVAKLSKTAQENLYISPLGIEAEKDGESDSEDAE